jgi:pimeloyl-ACP methyl ester carboxylesterase
VEVIRDDGTSLHVLIAGAGQPTNLFVHGLGQSASDVRIFGSGCAGTRAFVDVRGHGGSTSAAASDRSQWSYQTLAADVASVADAVGATGALGVSAGASTLLTLLVSDPARFQKVALVLPTQLGVRTQQMLALTDQLADAITSNSQVELARLLLMLQPESVRGRVDVGLWARRQAAQLGGTVAGDAMRDLPRDVAVSDLESLRQVRAEVLVLAQRNDEAHPVSAGEELVKYLPGAELVVSDKPWIWEARNELRDRLVGFFNS